MQCVCLRSLINDPHPYGWHEQPVLSAGYTNPKFMLPLHGRSLFDWALLSFESYRIDQDFVLVTRNDPAHVAYANERMQALGFKSFRVIELDGPTAGQAATVAQGLSKAKRSGNNDDLLVFNIDTIRLGFELPEMAGTMDGYVEVTELEGDHWSFVFPASEPGVAAFLTEKKRISNLCSTGLYYFRSANKFLEIYNQQTLLPKSIGVWKNIGEQYIAPLYNAFIENGEKIGYELVDCDQVWFSGTPAEYESALIDLKFSETVKKQALLVKNTSTQ